MMIPVFWKIFAIVVIFGLALKLCNYRDIGKKLSYFLGVYSGAAIMFLFIAR